MTDRETQKKSIMPALVIGLLLVLSLPLVYLLVARVILPLEWNEPQFRSEAESTATE